MQLNSHKGVVAPDPLRRLAAYLDARRDAILQRWHRVVIEDRKLHTSNNLTRVQLFDHVPDFLQALTQSLRVVDTPSTRSATLPVSSEAEGRNARDHGIHRWQQGYNVWEVTREFGHLGACIGDEMTRFAQQNSDFSALDMACAHRLLGTCINNGIEESVAQFTRGREAEARSRVEHLENVLKEISALERARGQALHAASHDMRGSLAVVEGAASMLMNSDDYASVQVDVTGLMKRSLDSLQRMISDFMGLSRLEAGQETLNLKEFDAALVLREFCETSQPLAAKFNLWLRCEGVESLIVPGDEVKLTRITQNLLLNALKYTPEGGVEMRWEILNDREWALHIADTGPGLDDAHLRPFLKKVQEASSLAHEIENTPSPDALPTEIPQGNDTDKPNEKFERLHPSEGIGLTIVKRLCEIVEARLEVESTPGKGAVFSVIFPRRYEAS